MATIAKPRGRKPVAHGPLSYGWSKCAGQPSGFRLSVHDTAAPHDIQIGEREAVNLAAYILCAGAPPHGGSAEPEAPDGYLAEAVATAVAKRGATDWRGEPGAAPHVARVFARELGPRGPKDTEDGGKPMHVFVLIALPVMDAMGDMVDSGYVVGVYETEELAKAARAKKVETSSVRGRGDYTIEEHGVQE